MKKKKKGTEEGKGIVRWYKIGGNVIVEPGSEGKASDWSIDYRRNLNISYPSFKIQSFFFFQIYELWQWKFIFISFSLFPFRQTPQRPVQFPSLPLPFLSCGLFDHRLSLSYSLIKSLIFMTLSASFPYFSSVSLSTKHIQRQYYKQTHSQR